MNAICIHAHSLNKGSESYNLTLRTNVMLVYVLYAYRMCSHIQRYVTGVDRYRYVCYLCI